MEKLTSKEETIYNYLRSVINESGYSPSIRDIKSALEIKSTSTVHAYLEKLEAKGYITRVKGTCRTVRLEDRTEAEDDFRTDNSVPILGKITAGEPILAEENLDGYIGYPVGVRKKPSGDLFALKVSGLSMIEAGILDGDYVIVESTPTAENGQIVAAMLNESSCATVKRFYREDGHIRLQPENSTYQPIICDDITILGRVISVVRFIK